MNRTVSFDLGWLAAIWAAAIAVVPAIYYLAHAGTFDFHIDTGTGLASAKWFFGVGILFFAAIPLVVGVLRSGAHKSLIWVAGSLLLACPLVYAVVESAPQWGELLRDAFFLATGSTLVYVSAMWARHFAGDHRWNRMLGAVTLLLIAVGAIVITLLLNLFLV